MKKVLAEFIAELPAQVAQINEQLRKRTGFRPAYRPSDQRGSGYGFPQLTEPANQLEQSIKESKSFEEITSHASDLIAILRRLEGYSVGFRTSRPAPHCACVLITHWVGFPLSLRKNIASGAQAGLTCFVQSCDDNSG